MLPSHFNLSDLGSSSQSHPDFEDLDLVNVMLYLTNANRIEYCQRKTHRIASMLC